MNLIHRSKFKIEVKSVKPFGCTKQFCKLQPPILYCVGLIMVTITSHILTAIFPREYFLAIKFLMGNEKHMYGTSFDTEISKVWEKVEK